MISKNFTILSVSLLVGCMFGVGGMLFASTELARINGSVISLEDFNKRYKENLKFFQFKTPNKKSVLDDMIKRELAIQEAKKMGLDRDPEVIDRMNTVLYHALVDKKLSKDFEEIKVSDDEAKAYYSKYPEIRTSHIFIAVRPDAPAAEVAKARERIQKIQKEQLAPGKMSFAEVAQRFSEGVAAPVGGDIDYQGRDKLDPAYYEAALKLKTPGKVSDIVRSQFGFHIIRLTATRPWDEVDKTIVKRMVFDERRNTVFERYMDGLRKQAKVTVKDTLLKD